MNKCEFCKKIMTDDARLEISAKYTYTLTVDTDDHVCDTCEAHRRAKTCARAICSDMGKYRDIARKDKIDRPAEYLDSKLTKLKSYWIEYMTEGIEQPKYSNWKYKLTEAVDCLTEKICDLEPENTKKERIKY